MVCSAALKEPKHRKFIGDPLDLPLYILQVLAEVHLRDPDKMLVKLVKIRKETYKMK